MQRALFQSVARSVQRSASHAGTHRSLATRALLPEATASSLRPIRSAAVVGPSQLHARIRNLHSSRSARDEEKKKQDEKEPAAQPPKEDDASKSDARSTSLFDIDTSTTLIEAAEQAGEGKEGSRPGSTSAKGRQKSMSSIERSRQTRTRVLLGLLAVALGTTAFQFGRELDEVEKLRFQGKGLSDNFFGRIQFRVKSMQEELDAPVFEKLLPDPLPFPYGRPYTLVVDLDGLMVHSSWSRDKGWRTAKRPGLDYFLGYLSQWYEIVLYTSQPFFTAGPIIEKLDPDRRFLVYLLFKESCRTVKGKIVKDLDALNRDLSKVIIMDTNPEGFSLHPENAILVKKWEGNKDDRELASYIPFLEAIGIYNIPDVRKTIAAYQGHHIPTEHARRQLELRALEYAEWQKKQAKASSLGGGLRGLVGSSVPQATSEKEFQTWYDMERKRFQDAYLEDEKYWRENGDAIRKQAKEDQERQLKEMKLNAWSFFTSGPPKPPTPEETAK